MGHLLSWENASGSQRMTTTEMTEEDICASAYTLIEPAQPFENSIFGVTLRVTNKKVGLSDWKVSSFVLPQPLFDFLSVCFCPHYASSLRILILPISVAHVHFFLLTPEYWFDAKKQCFTDQLWEQGCEHRRKVMCKCSEPNQGLLLVIYFVPYLLLFNFSLFKFPLISHTCAFFWKLYRVLRIRLGQE